MYDKGLSERVGWCNVGCVLRVLFDIFSYILGGKRRPENSAPEYYYNWLNLFWTDHRTENTKFLEIVKIRKPSLHDVHVRFANPPVENKTYLVEGMNNLVEEIKIH